MIKPITRKEFNQVARMVRDALRMASSHDPEHHRRLTMIERRLEIIARQLERLNAPQYRCI